MAGPFPPPQPAGEAQPSPGPASYPPPAYPNPPAPYPPVPYPSAGYPGPLPPPVEYPATKRRKPALWWGLGAAVAVAAVVAAVALIGGGRPAGPAAFTDAAAKSTIQNYLTALSDADTETVARNNACGMFDAISDRKSDLALARLASDAFRKQFTRAEVTSIDKIVLSSSYQAQVLFTMRVVPASGSRNGRTEEQGVAQLLRQDKQILVCSYLLRTAAQY